MTYNVFGGTLNPTLLLLLCGLRVQYEEQEVKVKAKVTDDIAPSTVLHSHQLHFVFITSIPLELVYHSAATGLPFHWNWSTIPLQLVYHLPRSSVYTSIQLELMCRDRLSFFVGAGSVKHGAN